MKGCWSERCTLYKDKNMRFVQIVAAYLVKIYKIRDCVCVLCINVFFSEKRLFMCVTQKHKLVECAQYTEKSVENPADFPYDISNG